MVRLPQPVSARVLFAAPSGGGKDWTRADLWDQAAAIPGVQMLLDPDGLLAHRFGAATSGQVLLYSADGRLLFQGGITAARGHEGDNNGSVAILALIAQRDMARAQMQTPVFGGPLYRHIGGVSGKVAATCSP